MSAGGTEQATKKTKIVGTASGIVGGGGPVQEGAMGWPIVGYVYPTGYKMAAVSGESVGSPTVDMSTVPLVFCWRFTPVITSLGKPTGSSSYKVTAMSTRDWPSSCTVGFVLDQREILACDCATVSANEATSIAVSIGFAVSLLFCIGSSFFLSCWVLMNTLIATRLVLDAVFLY